MSLNIDLLQQSFEKIKPHADEFVISFYENLFKAHPEVKPLFDNVEMGNQRKKLLNSLILVIENIRNPEALEPVLSALGARHVSYGASPEYYVPVGEALLLTLEQYLQQDWTIELKKAWVDAFNAITILMLKGSNIDVELSTVELNVSDNLPPSVQESVEEKLEEIPEQSPGFPVELLEQSFHKIKPVAGEFVASFYQNLFIHHPELKPLFDNIDMGNQQKKLLNSLILVVENLQNPEALEPVLSALGARHVGYGAIPKYYGPVGDALLLTFEQYLQEDWTSEVKKAWSDAYKIITVLMLKGTREESSSKITPTEKTGILSKTAEINSTTLESSSTSKIDNKQEKNLSQATEEHGKDVINNLKVAYVQLGEILQQIPRPFVQLFWRTPTWLVAIIATVIFAFIVVVADDNSILSEILGAADSISLVVALVLFIKEAPDRRKQFHYQAWSTIDTAHNVKVSYARILALQDLNEDGVSLRGLDAPGAELLDINLFRANLSKANLMGSDLSNANLSHANLDNANLSQSKLSGANLSHAKLGFASLTQANLSSTNLNNANLVCADLSNANLSGADLRNASLSGANLEGAYLTGANLKNAKVTDYELNNALLEGAIMPNGSRYKSQS